MSTCIRGGVRYKRHKWIQKLGGLICEHCRLFLSTVNMELDNPLLSCSQCGSKHREAGPEGCQDDFHNMFPTPTPL